MGLVQSFVPVARPMKFSTPIGATFGNSVQCRSPAVVWMMAVGSAVPAGAEVAGLRTGGFGFVAGCGVESPCAAPSRDVEIIRTSVCSKVRMDAPVSILANFNCTTIDPGLSVESRAAPPGRGAAAGARGRERRPSLHFLLHHLHFAAHSFRFAENAQDITAQNLSDIVGAVAAVEQ